MDLRDLRERTRRRNLPREHGAATGDSAHHPVGRSKRVSVLHPPRPIGFSFFEPQRLPDLLDSLRDPEPNAEPILFAILAEYQPSIAGTDEMGLLRHVHLDRSRIAELRQSGFQCLISAHT